LDPRADLARIGSRENLHNRFRPRPWENAMMGCPASAVHLPFG
jgi:hypothetical protein